VFPHLPSAALAELRVHLELLVDDPKVGPFLRELLGNPAHLVPDDVVDLFEPLLADGARDQPLSYYVHRALHRTDYALWSRDGRYAADGARRLRPVLEHLATAVPAPAISARCRRPPPPSRAPSSSRIRARPPDPQESCHVLA